MTTLSRPSVTIEDVLQHWLPQCQAATVRELLRSDERQAFRDILERLAATINGMPLTYEQSELGPNAIAYLHFFADGADWWITELDIGAPGDEPLLYQSQMFGLADLFGDGGELGYISLSELTASPRVEMDFHFTPCTIREIRDNR